MPYYTSSGHRVLLGALKGANFDTTSDQALPVPFGKYVIHNVVVTNASTSLTLAVGGIYTDASKGGIAVVAAIQVFSGLTGSAKFIDLTLTSGVTGDTVTASTLYLSLTTAQGSAATADLYLFGDVLV